jgi:geranylgeranyl diphosphate synthase type II
MAGGKRLRPVLTLAVADIFSCDLEKVLPAACAIEMIHTQSLIHDDLPAMDNDDLRRGKPTNHIVFGEDLAIISGDALFSYAFFVISRNTPTSVDPRVLIRVIDELAFASGPDGMCGGQAMDISVNNLADLDDAILQFIHTHKTGAMIRASVRIGAIISGATNEELTALTLYAENIGLAFQIIDDVLDITGKAEKIGKTPGKDQEKKFTYPRLYGLEESIKMAENHINYAIENLSIFGDRAKYLQQIAEFTLKRDF